MILRVQSPTEVVFHGEVIKVTVEAEDGYYTFLPRHVDFVTALVPGLLSLERPGGAEEFLAVDEGVLVKRGEEILVSAFSALRGADLGRLREAVEHAFGALAGQEEEAWEHYRHQLQEVEERREEMMAQAEQDARQRRQELIDEAREDAEAMHRRWLHGLQRERETFIRELRLRLAEGAMTVAREALRELADADLEKRMTNVFLRRLAEMSPEDGGAIARSIRELGNRVTIRTAFGLDREDRQRLVDAVERQLLDGAGVNARFETVPGLACGIELQADGRRIAWTLESYLDMAEGHVTELLEEATDEERGRQEAVARG